MKRRTFVGLLGGAAIAWPLVARAQQPVVPVVAFINAGAADASGSRVAAFRKGLSESGYVEGQNVTVEYHWFSGQYDRLPALMADLVRRRVAVIATPAGNYASQAAKAATTTIPIVFGVGEDPVKLGLVASLARPDGNATGFNVFSQEVVAKRLALLHELVPKAVRVAVLINPANAPVAETTLREVPEAARAIGLQIQVLNAGGLSAGQAGLAEVGEGYATRSSADSFGCIWREAWRFHLFRMMLPQRSVFRATLTAPSITRSEHHAARSAFCFLTFRRATSCMTDPIGKRSDDVEQVSGRAHQPVEAGDNQHVAGLDPA